MSEMPHELSIIMRRGGSHVRGGIFRGAGTPGATFKGGKIIRKRTFRGLTENAEGGRMPPRMPTVPAAVLIASTNIQIATTENPQASRRGRGVEAATGDGQGAVGGSTIGAASTLGSDSIDGRGFSANGGR